ncbi:MAG: ribosome maturation factor RimP [Actinobacteria bacterium]|nr:ribosome maturation factor RimP [Actinomycetota bacterium]
MSVARGSIKSNPVVDRVSALILPIVTDLGLELYDVEYQGGILRVVVDTPTGGPAGVNMESIALITRLISREFDHSDPVPGHYTLEVTSPGLERSLRVPKHFAREVGKVVAIRLTAAVNGVRRAQGVLLSADENNIVVRLNDKSTTKTTKTTEIIEMTISYDMIDRARTVFEWGPTPKSGATKVKTKTQSEVNES